MVVNAASPYYERRRTNARALQVVAALIALTALVAATGVARWALIAAAAVTALLATRHDDVEVDESAIVIRTPWRGREVIPLSDVRDALVVPRRSYATEVRGVPPRIFTVVVTRGDGTQLGIESRSPHRLAAAIGDTTRRVPREPPVRSRSEYLRRAASAPGVGGDDADVRLVDDADRQELAGVLLDAYRGTVDDEGENEQDALDAIDSFLGRIDRRSSVVVTEEGGRIVAMSFVVVVAGRHFIDPVATSADRKGRGLGTTAVRASLGRLHEHGVDDVGAVITDGNRPSEQLFARLGFERTGPWPRRRLTG